MSSKTRRLPNAPRLGPDVDTVLFTESSSKFSRVTKKVGTGVVMAEGFSYYHVAPLKKSPGYTSYRCVIKGCSARAYVNDETRMGSRTRHIDHGPDYTDEAVRLVRDNLERNARESARHRGIRTATRDNVTSVRKALTDEQLSATSTRKAFERSHQRASKRAREERGDEEANVKDTFGFTVPERFRTIENLKQEHEQFLLADFNENGLRLLIFMSETGRKLIEKYRSIALDGTFRIVPTHLYQLFTIHVFVENSSIPVVFCITNEKTAQMYKILFGAVDRKLRVDRRPKVANCDFEKGAIEAAKMVWPELKIGLCFFHFSQSIFRRIRSDHELLSRYESSTSEHDRTIMKSIQCLAFLPVQDVYSVFCALWDSSKNMDGLFTYFFSTYIGRDLIPVRPIPNLVPGCMADAKIREELAAAPRTHVAYSVEEWSVYSRTLSGEVRTNNAMEAWHGVINRYVNGKPTMSKLLGLVMQECTYAMQVYQEFRLNPDGGLRQRPQRFRYSHHDEKLLQFVQRYDEHYRDDPIAYLKCLSYHCKTLHYDPSDDTDEEPLEDSHLSV